MKNKLVAFLIIIVLSLTFSLVACDNNNNEQVKIVYLGDSIAEGLLGVSPISERDGYAYYSILGLRNEFDFKNRAVSGHKTEDMLGYIKKTDDVRMTRTLIKTADIIQISILGNDFLLNDLGSIIISAANEDFTLIDAIVEEARQNINDIVEVIRSYNKDAVIIFQNVYNPISPESTMVSEKARITLAEMGIDKSEYREFSDILLSRLNGILTDYLKENPNEFYIIDSQKEFNRIYAEDAERGKALIFSDWVHPSNEGHAVLADLNQALLEELGFADAKVALQNYKNLRIEQLERLFKDTVNVEKVKEQINNADSCPQITKIYFEAIKGKVPDYIKGE